MRPRTLASPQGREGATGRAARRQHLALKPLQAQGEARRRRSRHSAVLRLHPPPPPPLLAFRSDGESAGIAAASTLSSPRMVLVLPVPVWAQGMPPLQCISKIPRKFPVHAIS